MKHLCNTCGKYGHWKRDHNEHESLLDHMKSVDHSERTASNNANESFQNSGNYQAASRTKKKTMSFNNVFLVGSLAHSLMMVHRIMLLGNWN